MTNTWLHSLFVIALGAALLFAATWAAHAGSIDPASTFHAPLQALALLVPGLILGWFTRRHPLLVGGAAGLAASFTTGSPPGNAIAACMVVAVAALAGRSLRYRFRPEAR